MSHTYSLPDYTINNVPISIPNIVPLGTIVIYAGSINSIPSQWNLCDGRSLSSSTYSELYTLMGNKYGGDSSNFNLPDLSGQYILGTNSSVDSNNFNIGSDTLDISEIPSHTHTLPEGTSSSSYTNPYSILMGGNNTWKAGVNSRGVTADGLWISHANFGVTVHYGNANRYIQSAYTTHTHNISSHSVDNSVDSNSNYIGPGQITYSDTLSLPLGMTNKKLFYIIKITSQ